MRKEEEHFAPSSLVEGMTSIRAVLSTSTPGNCRIKTVYYDRTRAEKKEKELRYLRHRAEEMGFGMREVLPEELDALCIGNTHGGIAADVIPRTLPALKTETELPEKGFFVMIEGIEDPYNFGYALRSLYAAGVDGVVLPPRNWMSATGVVARASAGASEMIDMFQCGSPEEAADIFHARGYKVVCAAEDTPLSLQSTAIPYPVFLVIGGERRGISSALRAKADMAVRIDYGRSFGASLSAASAATVLAYEITRQNLFEHKD